VLLSDRLRGRHSHPDHQRPPGRQLGDQRARTVGRAWVAVTWIATGLGWALATLLVAGYTGLVRRE